MFLSDLISASDLIRFRHTQPSAEFIKDQDKRLEQVYVEYTKLLVIELERAGYGDKSAEAIPHALIAIASIDYLISKATEGPTQ